MPGEDAIIAQVLTHGRRAGPWRRDDRSSVFYFARSSKPFHMDADKRILKGRRPTMTINAIRNKRGGPGGGARRLHQTRLARLAERVERVCGGETGSTRVKVWFSFGIVSAVIGLP